jgi:hypothetical protein
MDRFLYAGYTFEQYNNFVEARECARIAAREKPNWDRHFKRVIKETLRGID